jgi:hypothetical protein
VNKVFLLINSIRIIVKFYKEYKKEKGLLDHLLNRFIEINKLIETENQIRKKTAKKSLSVEFYFMKKEFHQRFIDRNHQIQITRSDNQTLLDDIDMKKEEISLIEEEFERKLQVEEEFARRLKKIKLRKKKT